MNITHKLSLNKHPRACDNLSLITAQNIKIDRDKTCLTNEESIKENGAISKGLNKYFENSNYNIVGWIPCSDEVVIFAVNKNRSKTLIARYSEKDNELYTDDNRAYKNWIYSGGKIKGSFTYNVEGSLVIIFSEYGEGLYVPIKTINMGNGDDNTPNDLTLPDILIPCNPEVRLPICKDLIYIKGKTYKGIYYLYIRFKINTIDYTQWFPIGFPIYIDELQQQNIMKYHYNREKNVTFENLIDKFVGDSKTKTAECGYVVGCSDYFAIDNEFANYTFSVKLQFQAQTFDVVRYYKNIQIAWICVTKEDSKAYRTNDLEINYNINTDNNGNQLDYVYQFDSNFESLIESTVEEITPQYQNYFNVRTVINYKNKIYISNYEELDLNRTDFDSFINNIDVELGIDNHITEDNGYNFSLYSVNGFAHATTPQTNQGGESAYCIGQGYISNQRYTGTSRYISLDEYLGINGDVRISVYQIKDYNSENVTASNHITDKASNFGLYICAQKKNADVERGYPFGVVTVYHYTGEKKVLVNQKAENNSYMYSIYVQLQDSDERIYISHSINDDRDEGKDELSLTIAYGETPYIDTNRSFNERCQHATLIPGEIYNFYVHYVDKYGNVSNGYQIQNKIKWLDKTGNEVVPVGIRVKYESENEDEPENKEKICYYLVDYNEDVYDTLNRLVKEYNDNNNAEITLLSILPDIANSEYQASENDDAYISVKVSLFINSYYTFYNEKYKDIKWYQIALLPENSFFPFENTDGKRLFKVPSPKVAWKMDCDDKAQFGFKNKSIYTQYHPIFKNIEIPDKNKYCGFFFSYEKIEKQIITTGLLTQSDFMSQNYIYNSLYSNNKHINGRDGHTYRQHRRFVRNNGNAVYSSYMCFYSSYFDMNELDDKMDINMIRIEGKNVFKEEDIIPTQYLQQSKGFSFVFDQNKPQMYDSSHIMSLGIDEYLWCKANDEKNNRYALGTCLKINTIEELFDHTKDGGFDNPYNNIADPDGNLMFYSYKGEQKDARDSKGDGRVKYGVWVPGSWRKSNNNLYKASLLNISRSIYINDVKELIRMSDIKYLNSNQICTKAKIIRGLNGRNTIEGFLVYNSQGFYLNTGEDGKNEVVTLQGVNMYYPIREVRWWTDHNEDSDYERSCYSYMNECPFCAYLQMPIVQNYMHESKQFKSPPTDYSFLTYYHDDTTEYDYYNAGCLVEPVNSVDLFENKQSTFDDNRPITYTNYDENLVASSVFNRTIRRSNVIQDETRLNGWRKFDLEDYKVITENKGDITYLFGRNKMLFIHTQHSLFMLNAENTLKTEDKSVDLTSQDVFDVTYSEVVSSELGYAGLQDMYSCCYDQFGYIFYDQDNQRIYLLDNKTVSPIDDDIVEWLHKYKPTKVRFGHDRENNRVLIKMNYCPPVGENELEIVLSYNYISKTFVSLHSYHFDDAFSTKTKLYLFCNAIPSNNSDNNLHTNCSLHNFVQNGESYCSFDNVLGNKGEAVIMPSKIGIIYNSNYSDIKYLNSIVYKLNKKDDCQDVDYTNIFEELHEVPFAGDILKVYNNIFSTGELNIAIDDEEEKNRMLEKDMPYLKPYWELGNWNFSFIRDKGEQYSKFWKKISENYISPDNMARMAGNYFVIEFLFDNEKNNQHKIEFEDLDCNITKR